MFVGYSDLNLESSKGQRTLSARLDRAASNVCGRDNSKISVGEEIQIRACEKGAKETALASLDDRGRVQVAAVTIKGK